MVSAYPGTKLFEQTKGDLRFDGYFSDAAVSRLTKNMRNLVDEYPEIFASFQYIDNKILDRQFLINVNFFFLTLMTYYPYSSLAMSQMRGLEYPRGIMEFISRSNFAETTWLLSSDETRIAAGYRLLSEYYDTLEDEKSVLKEVLSYEKTAIDLVPSGEPLMIREFEYDIDGWISKAKGGDIPSISDFKHKRSNNVVFINEEGKIRTMILPSKIAEYVKSVSEADNQSS